MNTYKITEQREVTYLVTVPNSVTLEEIQGSDLESDFFSGDIFAQAECVGMKASEPDEDEVDAYPEVYLDVNLDECDEDDVEAEDKEAADAREAIARRGGAKSAEEQAEGVE